ncbi:hypothetical protein jhhlp_003775 [Lomentospora prolificans]|uniref:SET domain-containing protein n=1 Tax=Lomentospora prolificans TaxID=41688 RepID=A0A2N3N9R2_9PEZI|nr:hypothetical protein jhhlp_003775 [Lomentospora prolificans]
MDVKSIVVSLLLTSAPAWAARYPAGQCPADHGTALGATQARRTTCPLPVDDYTASRTEHWGPWTEEPKCVYPELKDEEDDVKFCVYTFGTYNLGEGISLLTTPEAAANIAGTLWDAEPAWRARNHLRRTVKSKASKGIKYRLKEIPGKGIGLIATRKISHKEVFLTDLPSLLIDSRLETLSNQPVEEFEDDRKEIYGQAVENLPGKSRVLGLAGSMGLSGFDNIFKTNSFLVAMEEGNHNGLFAQVSITDGGIRESTTTVTRNIPWGLPSDHRDFLTTNFFKFKCQCSLCTAPYEEKMAKDGRRRRMQEIEGLLKSDAAESYDNAVEMAQELINLANEEGLYGKMQELYLDLMSVFYDYADYDNALFFAESALGFAEDFEDPEGSTVLGIKANIEVLRGLIDKN